MAKSTAERVREHRTRQKEELSRLRARDAEWKRRIPLWQAQREAERAALQAEIARLTELLAARGAACPVHRTPLACPRCQQDAGWD